MSYNLTQKEVMEIRELVKTETIQKIAARFGVHERTINRWIRVLRSKGLEVETRVGRPPLLK